MQYFIYKSMASCFVSPPYAKVLENFKEFHTSVEPNVLTWGDWNVQIFCERGIGLFQGWACSSVDEKDDIGMCRAFVKLFNEYVRHHTQRGTFSSTHFVAISDYGMTEVNKTYEVVYAGIITKYKHYEIILKIIFLDVDYLLRVSCGILTRILKLMQLYREVICEFPTQFMQNDIYKPIIEYEQFMNDTHSEPVEYAKRIIFWYEWVFNGVCYEIDFFVKCFELLKNEPVELVELKITVKCLYGLQNKIKISADAYITKISEVYVYYKIEVPKILKFEKSKKSLTNVTPATKILTLLNMRIYENTVLPMEYFEEFYNNLKVENMQMTMFVRFFKNNVLTFENFMIVAKYMRSNASNIIYAFELYGKTLKPKKTKLNLPKQENALKKPEEFNLLEYITNKNLKIENYFIADTTLSEMLNIHESCMLKIEDFI